jgi:hypothetical protein
MTNHTFIQTRCFTLPHLYPSVQRAALIATAGLIALGLPGCTATNSARSSPGSVSTQPIDIAELLIEGPQSDRDGTVNVSGETIMLDSSDHIGLMEIAGAAQRHRDYATTYAAIQLALLLAPSSDLPAVWNQYGSCFASWPMGAAVVLSEVMSDDIVRVEGVHEGLSAAAAPAVGAAIDRAEWELVTAESKYNNAQGYIDDDEELIGEARMHAYAAHRINRAMPTELLSWHSDRILTHTRGDLWENQAIAADSAFSADVNAWERIVIRARQRAATTLELYTQGVRPLRVRPRTATN